MKRCPQCSEVYSDQLQFCLRDGSQLSTITADDPAPPVRADDDDYDTVVHPEPIVINIQDPAPFVEPVSPDPLPPQPESVRGRTNTIAVLIAGTIIGGLLVLVAILAFALVFRDRSTAEVVNVTEKNANIAAARPSERLPANTQTPASSPKATEKGNSNLTSDDPDSDEARREMLAKRGFNGRVIKINAIVRSEPSIDSDEVAVLPFDEPVRIGKPAAEHNPWYRITTADGTAGWMHGNTIEFTK